MKNKRFIPINYFSIKNGSLYIPMGSSVFVLDLLTLIRMISAEPARVKAEILKKHPSE